MASIGQAIGYEEISLVNESKVKLEDEGQKLSGGFKMFGINLLAKSTGDISEYDTHVLNWDKTESTGRILRGVEAMGMELNLAIVDIGIGLLMKFGKGKVKHSVANQ